MTVKKSTWSLVPAQVIMGTPLSLLLLVNPSCSHLWSTPAMPSLVPQTELDAVNVLLRYAGYPEATTLTGTLPSDVSSAQAELHRASRQVQSRGLAVNTDRNYTISPASVTGYLAVPSDALSITPEDRSLKLVQRSGNMWDLDNETAVFTADVDFRVVRFLAYADLPEPVKNHICMQATLRFLSSVSADPGKRQQAIEEAQIASADFSNYEYWVERPSMLDNFEVLAHMGAVPVTDAFMW